MSGPFETFSFSSLARTIDPSRQRRTATSRRGGTATPSGLRSSPSAVDEGGVAGEIETLKPLLYEAAETKDVEGDVVLSKLLEAEKLMKVRGRGRGRGRGGYVVWCDVALRGLI